MPATLDAQLETTFNDLASARLRDAAPALMDYLVGFELMKSEDDGAKAVGVFGAEVGGAFYFVPAFFINGEIQGINSIYSAESNLFFPLTEEWIHQLVGRQTTKLGNPDRRSRIERGVRMPNYATLRQLPGMTGVKFAAMASELRESDPVHLPEELQRLGAANGFFQDIQRFPKLAAAITQFYQPIDFVPAPTVKTAAEQDLVIVSGITDDGVKKLTDEQRKQVLKGGIAVTDTRPEEKKSKVYRTQNKVAMTNPTYGGLYEVVLSDGATAECIIGFIPEAPFQCVVYRCDDGKAALVDPRRVWTRTQYDDGHYRAALEKHGVELSKVRNGDIAVFISNDAQATVPFRVSGVITGVDDVRTLRISGPAWGYEVCSSRPGRDPWERRQDRGRMGVLIGREPNDRVKEVVIAERGNNSPKFSATKLVINSLNFRALVLRKQSEREYALPVTVGGDSAEDSYALTDADFGDPDTVIAALTKSAAAVGIWTEPSGAVAVRVNGKVNTFSKVGAVRYIAGNLGVDGELAVELVNEALPTPQVHRIKLAAELLPFPDLPDPAQGGFMSAHHPETSPLQGMAQAASPRNEDIYRYVSPFEAGGEVDADGSSTMETVERAAGSGQKEVFDAAILGALLKTKQPAAQVEHYIPTITSGMDRLGRILFLLCWNYDEFEEKYGESETAGFRDELESSFKDLGDVLIFLKKQTMAGDPASYGLGLSGDPNTSMDI